MKHEHSGMMVRVIKMISNKDMLSSILQITQMGQVGIRTVRGSAADTQLRQALDSQLKEYDSIEDEVHRIASQRGWQLHELPKSRRMMAGMMSRMKLMSGDPDFKIARMMIQGNTIGVINSLKDQHHWNCQDASIGKLSQKLLDSENANIRQMQDFL